MYLNNLIALRYVAQWLESNIGTLDNNYYVRLFFENKSVENSQMNMCICMYKCAIAALSQKSVN